MDNNQDKKPIKKSMEWWDKFRAQVAAGPLPETIDHLKKRFVHYRKRIFLVLGVITLLTALILGLTIGGRLAQLLRPEPATVSELPGLTSTATPTIATSFDALGEEIKNFNGNLPDPAPPAVEHDITLERPRR